MAFGKIQRVNLILDTGKGHWLMDMEFTNPKMEMPMKEIGQIL